MVIEHGTCATAGRNSNLTAAQARAQKEQKRCTSTSVPTTVRTAASTKRSCRQNTHDLVPEFARDYLVVDLRSSLS